MIRLEIAQLLPGIWTPPLSHTNSEIINVSYVYDYCVCGSLIRLRRNSIMKLTACYSPGLWVLNSKRPHITLFQIPRCASCLSLLQSLGWKPANVKPQERLPFDLLTLSGLPVSRRCCREAAKCPRPACIPVLLGGAGAYTATPESSSLSMRLGKLPSRAEGSIKNLKLPFVIIQRKFSSNYKFQYIICFGLSTVHPWKGSLLEFCG